MFLFIPIHRKIELTLKNVVNIYELLNPSKTNARNVLNPPLNTAGPMWPKADMARAEQKIMVLI